MSPLFCQRLLSVCLMSFASVWQETARKKHDTGRCLLSLSGGDGGFWTAQISWTNARWVHEFLERHEDNARRLSSFPVSLPSCSPLLSPHIFSIAWFLISSLDHPMADRLMSPQPLVCLTTLTSFSITIQAKRKVMPMNEADAEHKKLDF